MFNLLYPERLIVVGSSSSQQICEEAVTGKNKGEKREEREHEIRCQEVQKPPRHYIMGKYKLQRDTGGQWVFLPSFISRNLKLAEEKLACFGIDGKLM